MNLINNELVYSQRISLLGKGLSVVYNRLTEFQFTVYLFIKLNVSKIGHLIDEGAIELTSL